MTPKQKKRLNQFHEEYKQTEQRLQMAIQSLQGAQADLQSKRLRFEAAVEFVGGTGATWTYTAEDGVVVVEAGGKPPAAPLNGHGDGDGVLVTLPVTPTTQEQRIAAGATRRQIKKEFKK